ncbi:unnamed protein product [Amoebophrya sp. A25]|nr:unnamed protein product [Amoebophrya sp. A25]|eukprot:GSA25T00011320001.1
MSDFESGRLQGDSSDATGTSSSSSASATPMKGRRNQHDKVASKVRGLGIATTLLSSIVAADTRFLLASSPLHSRVSYVALDPLRGTTSLIKPLITPGGVVDSPQGICIDGPRNRLYVCDPGSKSKKVFWFELQVRGPAELKVVGQGKAAALQVEPQWCTVDHVGNLFFTDAVGSIKKVPAEALMGEGVSSPSVVEELYNPNSAPQLSTPAGLTTDNMFLFWGNSELGTVKGSLGRAPQNNFYTGQTVRIAANAEKVYGVCTVGSELYFTEEKLKIHAVKKTGGTIVQVADTFVEPRGCIWDGEGSVFVADRKGGAIYELPTALPNALPSSTVTKVFNLEDAYGVAVFEQNNILVNAIFG